MDMKIQNFQKLNPKKDVKLNTYDEALNFVFDDNEIKNVAISGPYSAGKSSMIESYKKNSDKHSFLHISLAHFTTEKKPNENELEGKILNQLIHQIDPRNIPLTNFKVKKEAPVRNTLKTTLATFLAIICFMYIISFQQWTNFVESLRWKWLKENLVWTTSSDYKLLAAVLIVSIVGYATYSIIKIHKERNVFKKLSFKGNEIELFHESDDSFFDKYLNEVLYLFVHSNADAIVFEDLDRYNVNQIFQKLREINTLINNKKSLKKDRPIRFFYLLRDDIFDSKDRTKFFDFIIPVVPVIDSSNSYDQFIKHFEQGGILEYFEEDFLQKLSLYIDDMRILKNIYNEFRVYYNRLLHTETLNEEQPNNSESIEINENKLLAIVTYKNIFPKDFGDLQLGRGYVHSLFESKEELIVEEVNNVNRLIEETQEKLNMVEDETLESIDELDAVYLLSNYHITQIGGKPVNEYKTRLELIQAIKANPQDVTYMTLRGHFRNSVESELNQLQQNTEYINRKDILNTKSNDLYYDLTKRIDELKKHRAHLENSRLKNIINHDNITKVFEINSGKVHSFNIIKESPYFSLIKFLVRNGYIDETYSDYMTYFYANSLSRTDKNFLLSITDQIPKEFSYTLRSPSKILSRMRLTDFEQVEVLNFDLLTHLLNTQDHNKNYLDQFINQIIETNNINFIREYLDWLGDNTSIFIKFITKNWMGISYAILNDRNFGREKKKEFVIDILHYSSNEVIEKQNQKNCITNFISKCPDFMNIKNPDIEKLVNSFILIGVKFIKIDYLSSNKVLFNEVYKYDLYELNYGMTAIILEYIYELKKESIVPNKILSLIYTKPNEPLSLYVEKNINQYIEEVVIIISEKIKEDESVALFVLNHPKITKDNIKKYLGYLETSIQDISYVCLDYKNLWSWLLEERNIKYSGLNIIKYFNENSLDSYLINFINNSDVKLHFPKARIEDKSLSSFFRAVLVCNELSNERYSHIVSSLNRIYKKTFSTTGINNEKILILINKNVIPMTGSTLNFMRENYPDALGEFITVNIVEYTKNVINADNFDFDELMIVLESNVVYNYKLSLLNYTNQGISINKANYSDSIKQHILQNNFNTSDLSYLVKYFYKESNTIKEEIKNVTITNYEQLLHGEYDIDDTLMTYLLTTEQLSHDDKKDLLIIHLTHLSVTAVKKYLTLLGMNDFLGLFIRKRPKFKVNGRNKKILSSFQSRQWITEYYEKNGFYHAHGRKVL